MEKENFPRKFSSCRFRNLMIFLNPFFPFEIISFCILKPKDLI